MDGEKTIDIFISRPIFYLQLHNVLKKGVHGIKVLKYIYVYTLKKTKTNIKLLKKCKKKKSS